MSKEDKLQRALDHMDLLKIKLMDVESVINIIKEDLLDIKYNTEDPDGTKENN